MPVATPVTLADVGVMPGWRCDAATLSTTAAITTQPMIIASVSVETAARRRRRTQCRAHGRATGSGSRASRCGPVRSWPCHRHRDPGDDHRARECGRHDQRHQRHREQVGAEAHDALHRRRTDDRQRDHEPLDEGDVHAWILTVAEPPTARETPGAPPQRRSQPLSPRRRGLVQLVLQLVRREIPSLRYTDPRCVFTVLVVTNSDCAISWFVRPSAASTATRRSPESVRRVPSSTLVADARPSVGLRRAPGWRVSSLRTPSPAAGSAATRACLGATTVRRMAVPRSNSDRASSSRAGDRSRCSTDRCNSATRSSRSANVATHRSAIPIARSECDASQRCDVVACDALRFLRIFESERGGETAPPVVGVRVGDPQPCTRRAHGAEIVCRATVVTERGAAPTLVPPGTWAGRRCAPASTRGSTDAITSSARGCASDREVRGREVRGDERDRERQAVLAARASAAPAVRLGVGEPPQPQLGEPAVREPGDDPEHRRPAFAVDHHVACDGERVVEAVHEDQRIDRLHRGDRVRRLGGEERSVGERGGDDVGDRFAPAAERLEQRQVSARRPPSRRRARSRGSPSSGTSATSSPACGRRARS